MKKKKIRWQIFLPPWLIMIGAVALNLVNYDLFLSAVDAVVDWILANFSWLFSRVSLLILILVAAAYFSPFRNVRIGGSKSRPMVKYSSYVWIVLCTIMGAGLMLWACSEPLYHLHYPPEHVAAGPMSSEAVRWGMESVFLEWTFTPMAMYGLPSVLFAFCFYNMKKSFAVSSMLTPVVGDRYAKKFTPLLDGICLFCLCAGMAGTLGSGILVVSGGVEALSGGAFEIDLRMWIIIGVLIVACFIISAASGLNRGIKHLSAVNSYFYLALGIIVFLAGPTAYLLNLCSESFGAYLSDFFRLSLWTSASTGDGWAQSWPIFYWCMSLAWMPVSGVFLGRISRGYTVREALNALFIIPSLFSVIWMALFSGSAVYYELHGANLIQVVETQGIASATYAVLEQMPLAVIIVPLFLVTAFVSYVTSADSNTNVIAGLCTDGLDTEDSEAPVWLKIVWGVTVGALSLIMLAAYDMEGMKMLATIGGFPAAFLLILFAIAFWKIMRNPKEYDVHKEDYDQNGKPIPSPRSRSEEEERKEQKKREKMNKEAVP